MRSGHTLFRQGERADHFFVIESGELEALVDGKVILRLGAGDHFGEACLLGGMRRIATVRACEPSVLWELDGKAFGDALMGTLQCVRSPTVSLAPGSCTPARPSP